MKTEGICRNCGAAFVGTKGGRYDKIYCSKRCAQAVSNAIHNAARSVRLRASREAVVTCKHCGAPISQARLGRRRAYCSENCTQLAWAKAHPDVIQARRKKHYARPEYRERVKRAASEWQRQNPEKKRATQSAWEKTEGGKLLRKSIVHRRRSRILGSDTPRHFTKAEFAALCRATGCVCMQCRKTFSLSKLEPDHIVPLSRGGSNGIGNIQPMCRSCNLDKGKQIMNWWTDYALEGVVLNDPREYGEARP